MITRSAFPIFMTKQGTASLRLAWEPTTSMIPEMRDDYFKVDSTTDAYYTSYGTVGMGKVIRKPETTPVRFDEPSLGRPFTMVFPTYALAVAISREAQEDDKKNKLVPFITMELKRAMIEAMEDDAASQYNDGFTFQGWEVDGVPLFSTAHPLLRSNLSTGENTSSNRHPTDAALSVTSLNAAYTAMRTTMNDTGRWVKTLTPVYLDVNPQLLPFAQILVGTQQSIGNNNNDKNLYYKQLIIRSNPRLFPDNPEGWSLSAGDGQHSWLWMNRRAPDFVTEIDHVSMVTQIITSARWGRGAEDWRGKYASAGPA